MEVQNRLLVIDGMALLFRAYYATSYTGTIRRTSTGIPTNAIYGFVQYLFDAVKYTEPTHVCCCWDMGSVTFRNTLYTGYKANRAEPPEELVPQFEWVKQVVQAMDVPNYGVEGYEADDCMGTIVESMSQHKTTHTYILTGDHDMLQLLTDDVSVVIMNKGKGNYTTYTPQLLGELKGLTPLQIPDLKGFMGDSSDNYPGVRGIGEKTALKLIHEYGSVEKVLQEIHRLPASLSKKISEDRDTLVLCKRLATIYREVPLSFQWDSTAWHVDKVATKDIFETLEMNSLLKYLDES